MICPEVLRHIRDSAKKMPPLSAFRAVRIHFWAKEGDHTLYFGSVRFFKNLILCAVCTLIIIPTALAFHYRGEAKALAAAAALVADDAESHGSPASLFEPDGVSATPDEAPSEEAEASSRAEAEPFSDDPPAYQSLYPDFYAPEAYHATTRQQNTVYLTFDDGPSERTDEILNVLADRGVKATFFVIGQGEEANLERMRRIVAEGHTIGMHSYTHDYNSVYSSVEGFLDEFYRIFCQIKEVTGVTPTVFRCPGGSINGYNGGFYQEILSEMIRRGFAPYDWNVSSEDAATNQTLPVETLVNNVVNNSVGKVRSIVLFHDSGPKTTTSQAIGPVIDKLRAQGYSFEPITPDTLPVLYNYTHI